MKRSCLAGTGLLTWLVIGSLGLESLTKKLKFLIRARVARFELSLAQLKAPERNKELETHALFLPKIQRAMRSSRNSPPIRRPTTNFISHLTRNGCLVCDTYPQLR